MSSSGNNLEARIRELMIPPNSMRTRSARAAYMVWARRRVAQLRNLQRRARQRKLVRKPRNANRRATGRTTSRSSATSNTPSMGPRSVSGSNNIRRLMHSNVNFTPQNMFRLIQLHHLSHHRHAS
jgi:hypothetical protein